MQTVLVTGAAGYLGSILTRKLLDAGLRVIALDTFDKGGLPLAELSSRRTFEPLRGDVRDENLLRSALRTADLIIPLAARVGAPACAQFPQLAESVNYGAVVSLLKLLSPQQGIIYPTTASNYGAANGAELCTEHTPTHPLSLYSATKSAAETVVLEAASATALRISTIFGMSPRMRLDLTINELVYRAVTDRSAVLTCPSAVRNFIHIEDAAYAFLHAIENFELMSGQIFNVGCDEANLNKRQICGMIREYIPTFNWFESADGENGDGRDYAVSSAKIMGTGWTPAFSVAAGIEELIKGYAMMPVGQFSNV